MRTVLVLLAVATLAVAGCGGGDGGSGGSGDRQDAQTAYRECLAEHGVELPDRGPRPQGQGGAAPQGDAPPQGTPPQGRLREGQDARAFQEAMQACADLRPEGAPDGHLSAAIQKLGVSTRAEALRVASDKGWL